MTTATGRDHTLMSSRPKGYSLNLAAVCAICGQEEVSRRSTHRRLTSTTRWPDRISRMTSGSNGSRLASNTRLVLFPDAKPDDLRSGGRPQRAVHESLHPW